MPPVPCDSLIAMVLATLRRAQRTVVSRAGVPSAWRKSREGQRCTTRIHDHGSIPGRSTLADFRHHPADQAESGEPSPLSPGTIIAAHVAASHCSPEDGDRLTRCTLPSARRGTVMATPVFYGWKIVIVCLLFALLSLGIGF